MSSKDTKRRSKDLGLAAVERIHREMQVDEPWTVREERGFTWWGAWIRQRIWAGPATRSGGETLWHVRARTPVFQDQPDEPATYARVNEWNALWPMGAMAYDPDDGTISARTGAFVYEGTDPWLERFLLMATGLQSSLAWLVADAKESLTPRDAEPHPAAGPRRDPDDMLNLAVTGPKVPSPMTPSILRTAQAELAAEGFEVTFDEDDEALAVLMPVGDAGAMWMLWTVDHPILGPGALARLIVPRPMGAKRGAWIANALNLAEAADWTGEIRPHAFGAWSMEDGRLAHNGFFPGVLLGDGDENVAVLLARNFAAWGAVRARFAGERLPWLEAAAVSRYPDDEPAPPVGGDAGGGPDGVESTPEPVPWDQRSFGPRARTARPRDGAAVSRPARDLLVDPQDPGALAEIDDAVAVAEDGDRILVRPGTYRTPVVVDRAIRIEGDGAAADIVLEPVGGEALGFAVSGGSVEGLTIRPARAGNDGADWSAVAVHNVEATIGGCLLSTHLGATVWVGGPSSSALVLDCTITGGAQNGVWVTEEGRARVVATRIAGNRWSVAVGGEHAVLEITDTEIVDNLDGGVAALDGALLVIAGSTVSGNAGTGILLGAAAPSSRIEDCTVERNSSEGILAGAVRGCAIIGNRVRDNGIGIGVVEGASPRVEGNDLTGNGTGIGVRGRGTDPVVIGNTVAGTRLSGVVIDEAAKGRFEGNTVSGAGGAGIWVDDAGTAPSFTGNQVSASGMAGVLVTDGAGGLYRSNDLRGNAAGSWKLDRPGDLERTGNLEDTGLAPLDLPDLPDAPAGTPGRLN